MNAPSMHRLLALVLGVVLLLAAAPAASAEHKKRQRAVDANAIVFVHGFAGSGGQFESQAMRFTSNGYSPRLIRTVEYDSTFATESMADVHARIDATIAALEARSGRDKVDVLGHSLGTTVMQEYLSSPARAANVGHYVNIDGRTATAPPGGVPTLALWAGRGTPGREITGATNVTIPNQTHVEVATSRESFAEIYRFFTGRRAEKDIVRQRRITLSGRAQLFPQNTVAEGVKLRIWEVAAGSGRHTTKRPIAKPALREDGSWGPVRGLRSGRHYEFTLTRGDGQTHHFYYEPFPRSDHLVRLLTSLPNAGVDALIEKNANHVAAVVVRYKELWGDQGASSDVLSFNGTNILNAATAPISKRAIGVLAFDAGSDGVTNLTAPISSIFGIPFLTGTDVFIPASPDAHGKVTLALRSRGAGPVRKLRFPNFPSPTDRVSLQLWDFE